MMYNILILLYLSLVFFISYAKKVYMSKGTDIYPYML